MATASKSTADKKPTSEQTYDWEGKDRSGKAVKGEIRAADEAAASASLRRQGIMVGKIKKRRTSTFGAPSITTKDIAVFTRQLATMMKAGVPLMQSFDIVAKGSSNATLTRLLLDIKADIESGTSMSGAFRRYPQYFDNLYCNLVEAGEAGGILEQLLTRLAIYQEKSQALKQRVKSAMTYPISVMVVAGGVVTVIMIFVIPQFEEVFKGFGAELPGPTQVVINMSRFFVANWYLIFGGLALFGYTVKESFKRSVALQQALDRLKLKLPVFGDLIQKSIVARWTRTLATLFAAGVPLVDALESVGGTAGNSVYTIATAKIQREVSTGTGLTTAMTASGIFPNMVLQMCSIGEESGALDDMLNKAAEFFEEEVDEMVKGLSSLMEPIIIVFLGTIIGGIVVAMYLPIFKMGGAV